MSLGATLMTAYRMVVAVIGVIVIRSAIVTHLIVVACRLI